MTKLNQLLAIEKGAKQAALTALTQAYHTLQNTTPLQGISRTYRPKDDDGDELPPESTRVQATVEGTLSDIVAPLARLYDVTAEKDYTNTEAKADVVVDGQTLVADAPPTFLLFLEKQLTDLHTMISKLPRLDPSETWIWDGAVGAWATEPVETHRTRKVKRAHVLYEATDRHPAQVTAYDEDEVAGYWKTVKFSGAIPADHAKEMLARVSKVRDAVKAAREEANLAEVVSVDVGTALLGYILGDAVDQPF